MDRTEPVRSHDDHGGNKQNWQKLQQRRLRRRLKRQRRRDASAAVAVIAVGGTQQQQQQQQQRRGRRRWERLVATGVLMWAFASLGMLIASLGAAFLGELSRIMLSE